MLLSGQHVAAAALKIHNKYLKAGEAAPKWCKHVNAQILKVRCYITHGVQYFVGLWRLIVTALSKISHCFYHTARDDPVGPRKCCRREECSAARSSWPKLPLGMYHVNHTFYGQLVLESEDLETLI